MQNTAWAFAVLDIRDGPLLAAIAENAFARDEVEDLILEAVNSYCWTLWKMSYNDEAMAVLQQWVRSSAQLDSLLLAQATMDLEWRRQERFLEYQSLLLMRFPFLEQYEKAWEEWLTDQGISLQRFLDRCIVKVSSHGRLSDMPDFH